jgi:oligopeptidase A
MSSQHPFLASPFHVPWSQLTPERIGPDIRKALEQARENIEALCRTDRGRMNFGTVLQAFEDALTPLHDAWGLVSHLDSVCNSPELREAYNAMLPEVSEFFAGLYLNESLWDVIRTFAGTPEAARLEGVQRRFLEETLADFRQSGADLPPEARKRLESLEAELARDTQKFSENVLDATNAWEMLIDDEAKLAGLPDSARAAALADARAKGLGTEERPVWRFTLKVPSLMAVLEHLDDGELRRRAWEASSRVGRDDPWDNTPLLRSILALRQEKAALMGKAHFADLVLERRMARNGERALDFVTDLHARIATAFSRQCRELQEFRAEQLRTPAEPLHPWEVAYWTEKRRRALYDFDEEELRPWFPIDGVLSGMFRLCERLFAIEIRECPVVFVAPGAERPEGTAAEAVEVWHPEVKFYEIRNSRGVHLGSFYADWHPRDSKRGGAWMNSLRTGRPPVGDADREPHLGLICGNMTPSVDGRPALLLHHEVETVFHEFGHLLHHLLGQVEVRSLNGVNVAWDFVELPSQIMENFCWERESLDFFARHVETGEPIPQKLFRKMLAARNYMSAATFMRQLSFARMDLGLHMHAATSIASGADLDAAVDEMLEGYLMPLQTRPPAMARRFTHLFASPVGYAAGYYSYKWAEVLDADCFSRFQRDGVLNEETGRAFRDCILAKGNSEPPEKLFRDFMGRDPELGPLLARSGLG